MAARTQNPAFDALMGGARRETPWQGAGPLPFSRGLRRSDGPLRAGDAAAVGDPFMGEGIGRALSAGPMIHAALQAAGPGPGLLLAYESLWRKAYGARLRLGWALRTILNWPALSGPLLTRLLRHPDLAGRLPPLFHGGFS
jgi:flavin-dependent dehydrogenase